MATPISSNCATTPVAKPTVSPTHTPAPTQAVAAPSAAASDRVAHSNDMRGTLLTAAAITALQVVPGVVEAEGLGAIGIAVGIGLRAATASGVGKFVAGAVSTQLTGYALSLMHDAMANKPVANAIENLGNYVNSGVHSAFEIPQSDSH